MADSTDHYINITSEQFDRLPIWFQIWLIVLPLVVDLFGLALIVAFIYHMVR